MYRHCIYPPTNHKELKRLQGANPYTSLTLIMIISYLSSMAGYTALWYAASWFWCKQCVMTHEVFKYWAIFGGVMTAAWMIFFSSLVRYVLSSIEQR